MLNTTGISIVLWTLLLLMTATVSPIGSTEVGQELPDFSIRTFDGNTYSRASFKGKPVLLIFWNTWCPTCMRELPEINRLTEKYGPMGLAVLAVNTAMNDSEAKAGAYWKKYGFVFPSGFDHGFEIGQALGVRGVPTLFLIDSGGIVRYKHAQLPGDMDEYFKQLIGKE